MRFGNCSVVSPQAACCLNRPAEDRIQIDPRDSWIAWLVFLCRAPSVLPHVHPALCVFLPGAAVGLESSPRAAAVGAITNATVPIRSSALRLAPRVAPRTIGLGCDCSGVRCACWASIPASLCRDSLACAELLDTCGPVPVLRRPPLRWLFSRHRLYRQTVGQHLFGLRAFEASIRLVSMIDAWPY